MIVRGSAGFEPEAFSVTLAPNDASAALDRSGTFEGEFTSDPGSREMLELMLADVGPWVM